MARIELSRELPDYFVQLDWQDANADPAAFSARLVRHYEAGDVVLLRNAPFDIDYELVNRVTVPPGRAFQKTDDRFFLYPRVFLPSEARALCATFGLNLGLYLAFRREVARVSAQVREFADRAFRGYRILSRPLTWRMTETGLEDLHLDGYGIDADLHYIRIFINLDRRTRLWNVSHRLDELAPRFYAPAKMAEARAKSADAFNKRLNLFVFGGKERIGRDGYPRHVVEFEQGDVWICDSRLVSHQIVSGRRLLATHFQVDPASMQNSSLSLESRVRRFHELYGR